MKKRDVPQFDELMNPTVQALKRLGGSASIDELVPEIVRLLALPQEITDIPHGSSGRTELEYRSAWARTYLRRAGLLENSERGIWALTPQGSQIESVDGRKIAREVAKLFQAERSESGEEAQPAATAETATTVTWQDRLVSVLQSMDPIAFERLCQRILRESGFIEVEVTKRSGDGGIDGHGTIRLGGLISFNVLFQSKRYKGNIGPDTVRDFRGAMVGRADKGVIISTGGFTLEARREATRDGAPPVDLIDGHLLAEKLKELKLGVKTNLVEHIEVIDEWFRSI
jgi:restriction system protein